MTSELPANSDFEQLRVWWFWCPHLDTATKKRDLVLADGTALFEIEMKARPIIVLGELPDGCFRGVKLFSEKQDSRKNRRHVRVGAILEKHVTSYLDPLPQSFPPNLKAMDKLVKLNDRILVQFILDQIKEALKRDWLGR